jgi:quercetin dioxygenase-like cupin family protein
MRDQKARRLYFTKDDCIPGVERGVWDAGPFTVVRYEYAPGSAFPVHHHQSAQITVVLSGRIDFHFEGEDISLAAGESLYVPGGVPHAAEVPGDGPGVVSLNIFHPPRKDHP